MNIRLRQLRKTLKLNQENFGKRLGVTGPSISRLEKGNRKITEQMILAICKEFGVNEAWLRFGKGSMFIQAENDATEIVSRLLEKTNLFYDLLVDILKNFNELDDNDKKAFYGAMKKRWDNE